MANKEESIKTKIELSGEREYKQSCTDLTKNLSVLSSQMRLTTNQFADNSTSMDALKSKSSILNSQVDEQAKKVDLLSSALAKSKQVYGENSTKAQEWEMKLNGAKIALNNSKKALDDFNSKNKGLIDLNNATEKFKTSIADLAAKSKSLSAIGSAFDNAKGKISQTGEKLKPINDLMGKAKTGAGAVGAGFKLMGDKLSEVGTKIAPVAKGLAEVSKVSFKAVSGTIEVAGKTLAAFGATAVAAGTAIFGITAKAGAAADDINTLAKVSGLSTEQLQKFQFASETIDVSMDTLTGSMTKLTRNMGNAKNGSESAQAAFSSLGVSFKDNVTGELRDNEDVFNDAISALGKIENTTERDVMAMQLFGKSAQDLNPLIMGGSDALKELGTQAQSAGLILGQDSLDKLNSFNDTIDIFKSTTAAAGRVFAVGFAEPLAQGMSSINAFIMDATKAFQQDGLQGVLNEVENAIPKLAESITAKLPSIITSFSTNLSSMVTTIAGTIPTLLNSLLPPLIQGATQLINGLIQTLPTLLPVIVEGAFTLFLGLIDGINQVLPQLIETLPVIIENVCNTLIENLPAIIEGGIQILVSLIEGITTTIPTLIEKVIELIPVITKALMDNLPLIIEAGMKLLLAVTQGIIAAIPQLLKALPQVISSIVSGLLKSLPAIFDVGKNIVKGLWEGICSMGGWLMDAIGGFFGGIVDGVKDFLGIHSPSRVFAGIGTYMAKGLGVGFVDEMKSVSNMIQDAIPTKAPRMAYAGNEYGRINRTDSATAGSVVVNQHIYAPVGDYIAQQKAARKQFQQIARDL